MRDVYDRFKQHQKDTEELARLNVASRYGNDYLDAEQRSRHLQLKDKYDEYTASAEYAVVMAWLQFRHNILKYYLTAKSKLRNFYYGIKYRN